MEVDGEGGRRELPTVERKVGKENRDY